MRPKHYLIQECHVCTEFEEYKQMEAHQVNMGGLAWYLVTATDVRSHTSGGR